MSQSHTAFVEEIPHALVFCVCSSFDLLLSLVSLENKKECVLSMVSFYS